MARDKNVGWVSTQCVTHQKNTGNNMNKSIKTGLTIGISSRALFDLDESHTVYEKEGLEAYANHQISQEEIPLKPGIAFSLVKKLLRLNDQVEELLHGKTPKEEKIVEILLLSRNTADTGLRAFNSLSHYELPIHRAAFTGGRSPHEYISAFGIDLFLSANAQDVREVLQAGYAAATILPSTTSEPSFHKELRIAFDGDAVLFSDEAERIYQEHDLEHFILSEKNAAKTPLPGGPFKNFLQTLYKLQQLFPEDLQPIRTALVTARSAPTHERVIRTLRAWGIRIDEALFLGGLPKGEFLQAFGADIFFDDQKKHCDSARHYVTTGHVPHGVVNES